MISYVLILITYLFTLSAVYTSEYCEGDYFERVHLSFNRSTNQLAYNGIPIQLDLSLETDLKHYKSDKLKTYLKTQPRPIPDRVLDHFINQTALDWCDEHLKDLRKEPADGLNYLRTREFNSIKCEYSCKPAFLVSADKTYKQLSVEQIMLKKNDGSLIVSIPRAKNPEYQLAYSEGGKLTTYSDIEIPSRAGVVRLTVHNTFPRLSISTECFIPTEQDIIFISDWILTHENIYPRYEHENTPVPDLSLAAYVPKPLKVRLLENLFKNFKKEMNPVIEIRKTLKSLWEADNPSVPMPKTLAALQAADIENKMLQKVFSHPTLSHDIGFEEESVKPEELSWEYVIEGAKNIGRLNTALMISDMNDITKWQDIFDLGTSLGFPEAPSVIVKSLLGEDGAPS